VWQTSLHGFRGSGYTIEGCSSLHDAFFAALVASTFGIAGQTTRPQFDAFEVATIKPTDPDSGAGRWIRMQSADPSAQPRRTLIAAAYDLNLQAISEGPHGSIPSIGTFLQKRQERFGLI
jgi:hypothetical protein